MVYWNCVEDHVERCSLTELLLPPQCTLARGLQGVVHPSDQERLVALGTLACTYVHCERMCKWVRNAILDQGATGAPQGVPVDGQKGRASVEGPTESVRSVVNGAPTSSSVPDVSRLSLRFKVDESFLAGGQSASSSCHGAASSQSSITSSAAADNRLRTGPAAAPHRALWAGTSHVDDGGQQPGNTSFAAVGPERTAAFAGIVSLLAAGSEPSRIYLRALSEAIEAELAVYRELVASLFESSDQWAASGVVSELVQPQFFGEDVIDLVSALCDGQGKRQTLDAEGKGDGGVHISLRDLGRLLAALDPAASVLNMLRVTMVEVLCSGGSARAVMSVLFRSREHGIVYVASCAERLFRRVSQVMWDLCCSWIEHAALPTEQADFFVYETRERPQLPSAILPTGSLLKMWSWTRQFRLQFRSIPACLPQHVVDELFFVGKVVALMQASLTKTIGPLSGDVVDLYGGSHDAFGHLDEGAGDRADGGIGLYDMYGDIVGNSDGLNGQVKGGTEGGGRRKWSLSTWKVAQLELECTAIIRRLRSFGPIVRGARSHGGKTLIEWSADLTSAFLADVRGIVVCLREVGAQYVHQNIEVQVCRGRQAYRALHHSDAQTFVGHTRTAFPVVPLERGLRILSRAASDVLGGLLEASAFEQHCAAVRGFLLLFHGDFFDFLLSDMAELLQSPLTKLANIRLRQHWLRAGHNTSVAFDPLFGRFMLRFVSPEARLLRRKEMEDAERRLYGHLSVPSRGAPSRDSQPSGVVGDGQGSIGRHAPVNRGPHNVTPSTISLASSSFRSQGPQGRLSDAPAVTSGSATRVDSVVGRYGADGVVGVGSGYHRSESGQSGGEHATSYKADTVTEVGGEEDFVRRWDSWCLGLEIEYCPPPPIHLIFSFEALERYNYLFRYLLTIHMAQRWVADAWRVLRGFQKMHMRSRTRAWEEARRARKDKAAQRRRRNEQRKARGEDGADDAGESEEEKEQQEAQGPKPWTSLHRQCPELRAAWSLRLRMSALLDDMLGYIHGDVIAVEYRRMMSTVHKAYSAHSARGSRTGPDTVRDDEEDANDGDEDGLTFAQLITSHDRFLKRCEADSLSSVSTMVRAIMDVMFLCARFHETVTTAAQPADMSLALLGRLTEAFDRKSHFLVSVLTQALLLTPSSTLSRLLLRLQTNGFGQRRRKQPRATTQSTTARPSR